ncbi:MAG: hypothetical protein ABFD79_00690 [Phycisphaerales bacterium]
MKEKIRGEGLASSLKTRCLSNLKIVIITFLNFAAFSIFIEGFGLIFRRPLSPFHKNRRRKKGEGENFSPDPMA